MQDTQRLGKEKKLCGPLKSIFVRLVSYLNAYVALDLIVSVWVGTIERARGRRRNVCSDAYGWLWGQRDAVDRRGIVNL